MDKFKELESFVAVVTRGSLTAAALAEGVVTGHPTMPEFRFDPGQIADFIAFLKTLQ